MPNYGGLHEDEFTRAEKGMEEIDIEFNTWFNREQPLERIFEVGAGLNPVQTKLVKNQIKQAFTQGYARGVAANAARPDPGWDDSTPMQD